MGELVPFFNKIESSLSGKFTSGRKDREMRIRTEMDFLRSHVQKAAENNKQSLERYMEDVDVESLRMTLLEAAHTGFSLSPHESLAYAIPAWNKHIGKIQFGLKISYLGFIRRVMDSGAIKDINCEVVYEKDKWKRWTDENGPHFSFEPAGGDNRGEVTGVFCYFRLSNGGWGLEYMNRKQILACRNAAKSKKVWDGPFGQEMIRKSCVRRARKYWPTNKVLDDLERDMQRLEPMEFDDRPEEKEPVVVINQQDMDKLVAFTQDLTGKDPREATSWVERTAKAMGYAGGAMDLPVDMIEACRERISDRVELLKQRQEAEA